MISPSRWHWTWRILLVSMLTCFEAAAGARESKHQSAAGAGPSTLSGKQPRRPPHFKAVTYPSPLELRAKYSAKVMEHGDRLMHRVAQVNEKGKWKGTWASLDKHPVPEWWLDAKFGMFVDWGLYSVAAYAPKGYADWYLHDMMGGTKAYHDKYWGTDFRQDDFIQLFNARDFNAFHLAAVAKQAGMRYVIPFLKHHDGFCLWDSSFTMRNSVVMGPHLDIAREWKEACEKYGLKFGFYYSIEDWVYPVIGTDGKVHIRSWSFARPKGWDDHLDKWKKTCISGKIPVRHFYSQYINPAAVEFIDKYDPDILWGDGDWIAPDAKIRKTPSVLAYFLNHAAGRKRVAFNDRWGCCRGKHGDFYTSENAYKSNRVVTTKHPWEENSGLSGCFGYNWQETDKDVRTAGDLVRMLVDIVSDGGNLLLITNLKPSGQLDPLMAARLKKVGNWLKINGKGIYATRRWIRSRQGALRFTRSKNGRYVYVFAEKWPGHQLTITKDLRPVKGSAITMLGRQKPLHWSWNENGLELNIPESIEKDRPCNYVWGFKIEAQPALQEK